MEKIPTCTPCGRKYPILPLMEKNTQLYPLWKKTSNWTFFWNKNHPNVPLMEENTQLYYLWQKTPNCTSYGRKHPIVPPIKFHYKWDVMLIIFQRSNINKLTNYIHYLIIKNFLYYRCYNLHVHVWGSWLMDALTSVNNSFFGGRAIN
jgi:hypothetical protein